MMIDGGARLATPLPTRVATTVDVSVLVPAKDEAENLPLFMQLAAEAFAADPSTRYEVVVIDDGSVDGSWSVLQRLEDEYPFLHSARHRRRAADGISPRERTSPRVLSR